LVHRIARIGPVAWLSLLLFAPLSAMAARAKTDEFKGNAALLAISYLLTASFLQTWVFLGEQNSKSVITII